MGAPGSTALKPPWVRGLGTGLSLSLVLSLAMTLRDWQLDPSGIFHGSGTTRWDVVFEAAWSWFWPLSLAAVPLSTVVLPQIGRRRKGHDRGART